MQFQHLVDAQQTYLEHLSDAWSMAAESILAAVYFALHGIVPDLFTHNGSDTLMRLHAKMSVKRAQMSAHASAARE